VPTLRATLALLLLVSAASTAAEVRRWVPSTGPSVVTFTATHPLGDVTGRSAGISGAIEADPEDLRRGVSGEIVIPVTSLRTGLEARDRDLWRLLGAPDHSDIRFRVDRLEPSFPSVADRADVLLTIGGTLRVRGVDHAVTLLGRVRQQESQLWVRGEAEVRMVWFGITPPRRMLMAMEDVVRVAFDILLNPGG
jgi:polyisoprenoid-binding protein YceI